MKSPSPEFVPCAASPKRCRAPRATAALALSLLALGATAAQAMAREASPWTVLDSATAARHLHLNALQSIRPVSEATSQEFRAFGSPADIHYGQLLPYGRNYFVLSRSKDGEREQPLGVVRTEQAVTTYERWRAKVEILEVRGRHEVWLALIYESKEFLHLYFFVEDLEEMLAAAPGADLAGEWSEPEGLWQLLGSVRLLEPTATARFEGLDLCRAGAFDMAVVPGRAVFLSQGTILASCPFWGLEVDAETGTVRRLDSGKPIPPVPALDLKP